VAGVTAWSGGGRRLSTADARRFAGLPGRWRDLAEGRIDPADLDDEEVFQGRLRQADGTLGPRPRVVPTVLLEEQTKRALHRGTDRLRMYYERCIAVACEIATDPNQAAGDRLKAATWVVERFEPKPIRVTVAAEDPVETLFRNILNDPDGLQDPHDVPVEPAAKDL